MQDIFTPRLQELLTLNVDFKTTQFVAFPMYGGQKYGGGQYSLFAVCYDKADAENLQRNADMFLENVLKHADYTVRILDNIPQYMQRSGGQMKSVKKATRELINARDHGETQRTLRG